MEGDKEGAEEAEEALEEACVLDTIFGIFQAINRSRKGESDEDQ